MPELPEVETIKLGLQKYLVGHTIQDIEIRMPKQFRGDKSLVIGAKVVGVRRFGKGLVIDLDNEFSIAIHVKMTGQLLYVGARGPVAPHPRSTSSASLAGAHRGSPSRATPSDILELPDKYTHIIFHLDNGAALYYRDIRQFGWVQVLLTKEISAHQFFKSLGKEPLKDLTLSDFKTLLQKTKTPIKILIGSLSSQGINIIAF